MHTKFVEFKNESMWKPGRTRRRWWSSNHRFRSKLAQMLGLASEWLRQKSMSKYFILFKLGIPCKNGHLTLIYPYLFKRLISRAYVLIIFNQRTFFLSVFLWLQLNFMQISLASFGLVFLQEEKWCENVKLSLRRFRLQILLPATGWICLWWSQIQLLHAL